MKTLRHNFLVLLLLMIGFAAVAAANDSAIQGTGGTPAVLSSIQKVQPLKGEHPSVRMVRERVAMVVQADYYDVIADFVFQNVGEACIVLMGFPEGASGDTDFSALRKKTAYQKFETFVDGEKVQARRIVANDPEEDFDFDAYWVKRVNFEAGQSRRVRVTYSAPLGRNSMGERYVYYDFTGGNWRDLVAESLLTIHFTVPGAYRFREYQQKDAVQQWRRGSTFYYRWQNWAAQKSFTLLFAKTLPNALMRVSTEKQLNVSTSNEKSLATLTIPPHDQKFNLWNLPITDPPDFVLRGGHSFALLKKFAGDLRYRMQRDAAKKKLNADYRDGLQWDAQTKRVWWLPGGRRKFGPEIRFQVGRKKMRIGRRDFSLKAAPFLVETTNSEKWLYVPLAPLIEVLQGRVKVNPKSLRVWFDLPLPSKVLRNPPSSISTQGRVATLP